DPLCRPKVAAAMCALRSLLLLLLPLCPGPGPGPGIEAKVTRSCTETRQILGARGYSLSLLPPALISGEHLRICPQEYTCCSSEIEQKLTWETEATFRGLVEESGSFLVHTLAARHRRFDEVFREVLSSAEHSLSLLFPRSFGRLYAQHTSLFSGLFSRLRDYYERSGEGLDDALVDFWAQLLEKMFPLLHPQYIFSPDYLFCLTRLASSADDSLKPFGDSPRRLRLQITRALVAARAFIQGLETGRDVVSETLKMPLSEGCKRAVMRLTGCPLCRGVPSLPPCRGFCLNVAHGCIGSQGLDPDWGAYLDGLLYLSPVVGGPQAGQIDNPELDAEASSPDLQTRRRRLQLRAATTRMKAAALGRDLELEDWEGQHYADDWMAGAAAVAPPARPPRPPRRDGAGGRGGGVIIRHSQDKSRTGGTSVGFHTQPLLILFLSALALLGPR
ncbi:hypothetical protein E2I00_000370, partial [Balaenoptera physalus]